jgi:hypothetical protein
MAAPRSARRRPVYIFAIAVLDFFGWTADTGHMSQLILDLKLQFFQLLYPHHIWQAPCNLAAQLGVDMLMILHQTK